MRYDVLRSIHNFKKFGFISQMVIGKNTKISETTN